MHPHSTRSCCTSVTHLWVCVSVVTVRGFGVCLLLGAPGTCNQQTINNKGRPTQVPAAADCTPFLAVATAPTYYLATCLGRCELQQQHTCNQHTWPIMQIYSSHERLHSHPYRWPDKQPNNRWVAPGLSDCCRPLLPSRHVCSHSHAGNAVSGHSSVADCTHPRCSSPQYTNPSCVDFHGWVSN